MRSFIRHNSIISVSADQFNAADAIVAGGLRHLGSLCCVSTTCVRLYFQRASATWLPHLGLKHGLVAAFLGCSWPALGVRLETRDSCQLMPSSCRRPMRRRTSLASEAIG